jgi:hypothetical protein
MPAGRAFLSSDYSLPIYPRPILGAASIRKIAIGDVATRAIMVL